MLKAIELTLNGRSVCAADGHTPPPTNLLAGDYPALCYLG